MSGKMPPLSDGRKLPARELPEQIRAQGSASTDVGRRKAPFSSAAP